MPVRWNLAGRNRAPGVERRPAPDFTLSDQDGKPVSLSDFSGRRVVLYFYPRAMTPGCTLQAGDFRDSYREFVDAGMAVVGISGDPPERLARFRQREGLPFPLLYDKGHAVAEAYGAWGAKKLFGLVRTTFVVGPDGVLEQEFSHGRARGMVDDLKEELLNH